MFNTKPVAYLTIDDVRKYTMPAGVIAYRQCSEKEPGAFPVYRAPEKIASNPDEALALKLLEAVASSGANHSEICSALMKFFDHLASCDMYLMPIVLDAWLNNRVNVERKELVQ